MRTSGGLLSEGGRRRQVEPYEAALLVRGQGGGCPVDPQGNTYVPGAGCAPSGAAIVRYRNIDCALPEYVVQNGVAKECRRLTTTTGRAPGSG